MLNPTNTQASSGGSSEGGFPPNNGPQNNDFFLGAGYSSAHHDSENSIPCEVNQSGSGQNGSIDNSYNMQRRNSLADRLHN